MVASSVNDPVEGVVYVPMVLKRVYTLMGMVLERGKPSCWHFGCGGCIFVLKLGMLSTVYTESPCGYL